MKNWRGRPLCDYTTIIELIGSTTTKGGLTVSALLDEGEYPTGQKVTNVEMKALNLEKSVWHGEWNYALVPQGQSGSLF